MLIITEFNSGTGLPVVINTDTVSCLFVEKTGSKYAVNATAHGVDYKVASADSFEQARFLLSTITERWETGAKVCRVPALHARIAEGAYIAQDHEEASSLLQERLKAAEDVCEVVLTNRGHELLYRLKEWQIAKGAHLQATINHVKKEETDEQ
jgi:hypothetical protein